MWNFPMDLLAAAGKGAADTGISIDRARHPLLPQESHLVHMRRRRRTGETVKALYNLTKQKVVVFRVPVQGPTACLYSAVSDSLTLDFVGRSHELTLVARRVITLRGAYCY
jgi:hypothetical protein